MYHDLYYSKKLGDNTLSDDIESYIYFDPDEFHRLNRIDCDVILLVTYPNNQQKSNLLLCRFFDQKIPKFKNSKKVTLLNHLLELVAKNNHSRTVERRRTGGALGIPSSNRNVLKLLHQRSSSPRKGKGVVCLLHRNRCKWRIFYISTKTGEVKNYTYSNLQTGGKFYMSLDLFKSYPFLSFFCLSKALTILILEAIGLSDVVSPMALSIQKKRLNTTNSIVQRKINYLPAIDKGINWETSSLVHKFCYIFSTHEEQRDIYTLVCHPVGRHNDTFESGTTSKLENRFCMFLDIDKHNKTNVKDIDVDMFKHPYGRGGNGMSSYSFAVLDW